MAAKIVMGAAWTRQLRTLQNRSRNALSAGQKRPQHSVQAETPRQATEQQWTADPHAGERAGLHVLQNQGPLRVARQRGDQTVGFAARPQHVLAAQRPDRAPAHPAALAHALDGVELAVARGDPFAHEHGRVVHGVGPDVMVFRA